MSNTGDLLGDRQTNRRRARQPYTPKGDCAHSVVALLFCVEALQRLLSLLPTFCRPALSAEVHVCQAHCPTTTWRRLRAPALFLEAPPCFQPDQRTRGALQFCICSLLYPTAAFAQRHAASQRTCGDCRPARRGVRQVRRCLILHSLLVHISSLHI